MSTEQDEFARELDHALRRVRSTGDIDRDNRFYPRASPLRLALDAPATAGPRALRFPHPDTSDHPDRRFSTPAPAHTRDVPIRAYTLPPLNVEHPPQPPPPPPPPPPHAPRTPRRRPPRPVPPGFRGKLMVFFGLAGPNAKARSQLISVAWKLTFGFVQYVVVITLLAVAAHRQSPTAGPGTSEWQACAKPLAVWDCIWLVRVAMGCTMGYWDWRRNLALERMERAGRGQADTEAQTARASNGAARRRNSTSNHIDNAQAQNTDNPQTETPLPHTALFRRLNILTNTLSMVWFLVAHIFVYSSINTCRHSSPHLWWLTFGVLCILYLMLLEIFLIGLLIFILGPILYLFYNIILLCLGRHPLQHVGEVNADIKKIPKSVVDKIPLVLYIPPPPEDPIQKPGSSHKDSEGEGKEGGDGVKVPEPAHMYPPTSSSSSAGVDGKGRGRERKKFRFAFLRTRGKAGKGKGRSGRSNGTGQGKRAGDSEGDGEYEDGDEEEGKTWEDNWVAGEYPFVRLEGNRAACAICLMDFDEPERVSRGKGKDQGSNESNERKGKEGKEGEVEEVKAGSSALGTIREEREASTDGKEEKGALSSPQTHIHPSQSEGDGDGVEEVQVDEVTPADAERLNLSLSENRSGSGSEGGAVGAGLGLEDAGEGAQPLRLLGCGHVFHKTCVDPWLTDVSGRCPVCQRPVEVSDKAGKKKRPRGGWFRFGRRRQR